MFNTPKTDKRIINTLFISLLAAMLFCTTISLDLLTQFATAEDVTTELQVNSADCSAPTRPSNSKLNLSNITNISLTLTWTPATDNVGVTAYHVFKDNIVIATKVPFYGLGPETAATCPAAKRPVL